MSDVAGVIERLRDRIDGTRHWRTAGPDEDMQEMEAAITHLSARIAELERERDEARRNEWPFGPRPNPVMGHTFGDFAVWGDEKSIKRVQSAMHEHDAMMPARIERIKQEAARAEAAEAKLAKAEEALAEYQNAVAACLLAGGLGPSDAAGNWWAMLVAAQRRGAATLSPMPNKEG